MMRLTMAWPLLIFGLFLSVFTYTKTAHAQSPLECDAYARNEVTRSGSMIGGAARGAARGAAFGAIVGGDSRGAKRGASLGAVAGGVRRNAQRNAVHTRAYDDCMTGRVKW